MQTPPFLSIDERIQYLFEREYFSKDEFSEEHRQNLESMNFHYFLGYARNYRALVGRGQIQVDTKNPDDVFKLIELDSKLSAFLHEGLRAAEWRLRSLAVKHYCSKFSPAASFLNPDNYVLIETDSNRRLVEGIVKHIFRHDEPYVANELAARAKQHPGAIRYSVESHEECVTLASNLPLWSVVDSFSLGLLGQFIMCCDKEIKNEVWRQIARDLDIAARVFDTQLKSLAYLRNTVAHHARLWMRPTADSAKKPELFNSRLRNSNNKSMYWAMLNLATFLDAGQRMQFANNLDSIINENPIYAHGIKLNKIGD